MTTTTTSEASWGRLLAPARPRRGCLMLSACHAHTRLAPHGRERWGVTVRASESEHVPRPGLAAGVSIGLWQRRLRVAAS